MSERYHGEATSAELTELAQHTEIPVENNMAAFEDLYYGTSAITAPGNIGDRHHGNNLQKRPLSTRRARAVLFQEAFVSRVIDKDKNHARIERKKIYKEAKQRDLLAAQYLNQKKISVELPDLGTPDARVVDLCLPLEQVPPENANKPPIFFIPGISNDVECVQSLAEETALTGRRVIVIGYPESFNGQATPEFADAVATDPDYGPHIAFYKAALDKILGKDTPVEIWGYSTGATIAAAILNDTNYQNRTANALLLCPSNCLKQSAVSMAYGFTKEKRILKDGDSARYMFTRGSKIDNNRERLALNKKIFGSMVERAGKKFDFWKNARVQEGGKITVAVGEYDQITKSYDVKDEFSQNPQNEVVVLPKAGHLTPFTKPKEVLGKITK